MMRSSEATEGPGHFPCLKPADIAKWTETVSGSDISEPLTFGLDDFLPDMADSKDDGFSITSSAPDSAYMSQSDTGLAKPGLASFFQGSGQGRRHAMDSRPGNALPSTGIFSDFSQHTPFGVTQQFPASSHASDFGDDSSHILFTSPVESRVDALAAWNQSSWMLSGSGQEPRSEHFEKRAAQQNLFSARFSQPMEYSLSQSTHGFNLAEDNSVLNEFLNRSALSGVRTPTSSLVSGDYARKSNLPGYIHDTQDMIFDPSIALQCTGTGSAIGSPEGSNGDVESQEDGLRSSTGGKATGPSSRSGEEGARSDPLYKATPDPDGQYRCPFAEKAEDCGHKATKLKCNYDKYIDSHLKPFRCRGPDCAHHQFSSTACLLRHEREMHGMHGHGSRPHLCLYDGCERAAPGHGFPRRYNLLDHMRRVHDYVAGTVEAPAEDIKPEKKSRKRKTAEGGASAERGPRKRTPSSPHPSTRVAAYPPAPQSEASSRPAPTRQANVKSQAAPTLQQQAPAAIFPPQVIRPASATQAFSADFQSTVGSFMSHLARIKGPHDEQGLQVLADDWAKLWTIVKDANAARTA